MFECGRRRRRGLLVALAALAVPALAAGAASPSPTSRTVIVTMRAPAATPPPAAPGDGGRVAEDLRRRSAARQRGIRSALAAGRRNGRVARWSPLWIADAVEVTATADLIAELARRPDVVSVTDNADARIAPSALPAEPGVALTGAPAVWATGDTGQGVVVASLDSGVDVTHPALAASWRGGTNSWFDPYGQHPVTPTDGLGHGTESMGVMVGDGGIGMAPGAKWIAGRVFDDQGNATIAAIHQAFQWVLDPDGNPATADAPSIVLNSWTGLVSGCDATFEPDLQALVAAGILPVFAAGNSPTQTISAANTSPANLPEAFAVAATDATDTAAWFSMRGPSQCKRTEFPKMSAPGVGVRTSGPLHGFATVDGTSFAAPHVAGAAALILSAAPATNLAGLESALTTTAKDLGAPGFDAVYGFGRLDALAAVQSATGAPPPPDTTPPNTFPVSAAPTAVNAPPVAVTATVTDARSPIAAAEAFFDAAGPDGTGTPLAAADGAFDTTVEQVVGSVPGPVILAAAAGAHRVLVHGRDSAGNWGAVTTADVVIDRTGPSIAAVAGPVLATQGDAVAIHTPAADPANGLAPASNVTQAQVTVDGAGTAAVAVVAADGVLDAPVEALVATLDTALLAPGAHRLDVRARDAVGNWGTPSSLTVVVRPAGVLLADDFESGRTARWTRRTGSATVTRRARVSGAFGLSAPAGRARAFLEDDTPDAEAAYRASVTVDARGAIAHARDVLVGLDGSGGRLFAVQLRATARSASIRPVAGGVAGAWRRLPHGVGVIELTWRAGPAGTLSMSVAGRTAVAIPVGTVSRLERTRIGAVSAGASGDAGRIGFDGFASSRIPRGAVTLG
jgi:serine protease AprX